MSTTCENCRKNFKYPYLLQRHQKRKNKCRAIEVLYSEQVENRINSLEDKVEQLQENLETNNFELYKCQYCHEKFTRSDSLSRHLSKRRCRSKNDNVDIFERELGIEKQKCDPLTCRFCHVTYTKQQAYSRHMNAECKEKIKYEHELEKRVLANRKNLAAQKVASVSINGNNNTANNTVNNNNNIFLPPMNAFGSENLDYITTKMLLKQIEFCKDFTDITETVKTFTRLIHAHPAHPENHNVLLKGNNTAFAEIFNGKQFEQSNALVVEDQILQKVGKLLLDKKNEYCDEQTKKEKEIPRQIESGLIRLEESIDDNINNELFRETVADSSRNLTAYRNTVKGALVSNREEIQDTQNLIKVD